MLARELQAADLSYLAGRTNKNDQGVSAFDSQWLLHACIQQAACSKSGVEDGTHKQPGTAINSNEILTSGIMAILVIHPEYYLGCH
jgi:hypothetical protein